MQKTKEEIQKIIEEEIELYNLEVAKEAEQYIMLDGEKEEFEAFYC